MRFIYSWSIFLLISSFGTESAKITANSKCNNKTLESIDRQIGTVFPFLNKVKLPVNEKQLQKYCVSSRQAMDNMLGYVKSCTGTFGPFMAKTIQTEYNREFNLICKSVVNERTRDLMIVGKCLNGVSNKLDKCSKNALDALVAVQNAPDKDRIHMMCCHTHQLTKCIDTTLNRSESCNKNLIPDDNGFNFMTNTIRQFCGEYFGSNNKCEKLIASTPKLDQKLYVRPRSFFMPLIQVLESYRNIECTTKVHKKMDDFVAEMITIGKPDPIPENSKQLNQWCKKSWNNIPFMYGYAESCTSDFGKFLAKIILPFSVEGFQPYCINNGDILDKPSQVIQDYMKAAKCGNRAEDKLVVCFDQMIDGMEGIIKADDMSRIRMSCCNAYRFRSCIFNATSTTRGCSAQTIQWAEQSVLMSAQPLIDIVCPNHWNSDQRCLTLLADIPEMDAKTYVRPKSIFMPFMKLLDSFPDVDLDEQA